MTKSKLLRKSFATIIVVAMFLLSYIPIAAEEEVQLPFISKDIYLDGIKVNNYELNYPFVTKDDRTYLPLTQDMGKTLGFQILIDQEQKLIQVLKTQPGYSGLKNSDLACNLEDQVGIMRYDYVVVAVKEYGSEESKNLSKKWRQIISPIIWSLADLLSVATNQIVDATPNTEVFMLGEEEILFVDDIPYVPLSSFRESKMFGWDAYYDDLTGLYISTDSKISAQSYYSQNNASYIEGRASYIRNIRPELSLLDSYYYEYLFRHEADVYKLDQELLMAVSRTECSFQTHIRSSAGAVGMMQIMPKTAIAYGITELQLEDPHINIEFGTRYIRDRLWMFHGDIINALSAYNQGVKKVTSGDHKTGYAEKCVYNEGVIEAWIANRGYSNALQTKLASANSQALESEPESEAEDLQIYR